MKKLFMSLLGILFFSFNACASQLYYEFKDFSFKDISTKTEIQTVNGKYTLILTENDQPTDFLKYSLVSKKTVGFIPLQLTNGTSVSYILEGVKEEKSANKPYTILFYYSNDNPHWSTVFTTGVDQGNMYWHEEYDSTTAGLVRTIRFLLEKVG